MTHADGRAVGSSGCEIAEEDYGARAGEWAGGVRDVRGKYLFRDISGKCRGKCQENAWEIYRKRPGKYDVLKITGRRGDFLPVIGMSGVVVGGRRRRSTPHSPFIHPTPPWLMTTLCEIRN